MTVVRTNSIAEGETYPQMTQMSADEAAPLRSADGATSTRRPARSDLWLLRICANLRESVDQDRSRTGSTPASPTTVMPGECRDARAEQSPGGRLGNGGDRGR